MSLTADIGSFLELVRFEHLPAEAVALARDAYTDTIGVIMAGVNEPVTRIVLDECHTTRGALEARACLSVYTYSALDAALISGTAAHAHDFDDQALTGHPSAVLVSALVAEGELLRSTGAELVTAYVAGYEVWAELIRRSSGYHTKGWHPTSVFGTVSAAAAASVLRRLPAERAVAAMAIASTHASGLAVNFGTMTKPYHVGMAARAGLMSTHLAARGATASIEPFEHYRGFLTAFSTATTADWKSPTNLGREWHLLNHRLCVKRYPTCYFMHRSFDATVRMLAGRHLRPEQVAAVEVTMGKGQTAVLVNERPTTGLQAKFSEHFAMAAAIVLGRMGIDELSDTVVQRPDIQAFFPKVRLIPVDEYDARDPAHSPTERVVIRLVDGTTLDTGEITSVRGHAFDPLPTEELWAKFRECTAHTHSAEAARQLFDCAQSIARLRSTRDLPTCENVFRNLPAARAQA